MSKPQNKSWTQYRHSTEYLAQGSSTSSKIPAITDSEPALIAEALERMERALKELTDAN